MKRAIHALQAFPHRYTFCGIKLERIGDKFFDYNKENGYEIFGTRVPKEVTCKRCHRYMD